MGAWAKAVADAAKHEKNKRKAALLAKRLYGAACRIEKGKGHESLHYEEKVIAHDVYGSQCFKLCIGQF